MQELYTQTDFCWHSNDIFIWIQSDFNSPSVWDVPYNFVSKPEVSTWRNVFVKMSDYVVVVKKLQNFEVLLQYLLWRWLDLKKVNFQLSSWVTGTVFSHRQYTADDYKFTKRDDMGDIVTFSDYRQYIDGLLKLLPSPMSITENWRFLPRPIKILVYRQWCIRLNSYRLSLCYLCLRLFLLWLIDVKTEIENTELSKSELLEMCIKFFIHSSHQLIHLSTRWSRTSSTGRWDVDQVLLLPSFHQP